MDAMLVAVQPWVVEVCLHEVLVVIGEQVQRDVHGQLGEAGPAGSVRRPGLTVVRFLASPEGRG